MLFKNNKTLEEILVGNCYKLVFSRTVIVPKKISVTKQHYLLHYYIGTKIKRLDGYIFLFITHQEKDDSLYIFESDNSSHNSICFNKLNI